MGGKPALNLEEVNCCDVPNKAADDTDYTDVENDLRYPRHPRLYSRTSQPRFCGCDITLVIKKRRGLPVRLQLCNVVEMMGAIGYYQTAAMFLNIDRYPLPDGVAPELKPLSEPIP